MSGHRSLQSRIEVTERNGCPFRSVTAGSEKIKIGTRKPEKPPRLDAICVSICSRCGEVLEVSPGAEPPRQAKRPKRFRTRCSNGCAAPCPFSRFVRVAAVSEALAKVGS